MSVEPGEGGAGRLRGRRARGPRTSASRCCPDNDASRNTENGHNAYDPLPLPVIKITFLPGTFRVLRRPKLYTASVYSENMTGIRALDSAGSCAPGDDGADMAGIAPGSTSGIQSRLNPHLVLRQAQAGLPRAGDLEGDRPCLSEPAIIASPSPPPPPTGARRSTGDGPTAVPRKVCTARVSSGRRRPVTAPGRSGLARAVPRWPGRSSSPRRRNCPARRRRGHPGQP